MVESEGLFGSTKNVKILVVTESGGWTEGMITTLGSWNWIKEKTQNHPVWKNSETSDREYTLMIFGKP